MVVSFNSSVISSRIRREHLPHFFFAHTFVIAAVALAKTRTQASRQEAERTSCQANATAGRRRPCLRGRIFAVARSASETGLCQRASGRGQPACQYLTGAIENRDLPLGKKTRRHFHVRPRSPTLARCSACQASPCAKTCPLVSLAPSRPAALFSQMRLLTINRVPAAGVQQEDERIPAEGQRSAPAPFLPLPLLLPLSCAASAFVRFTCPCSVRLRSPSSVCALSCRCHCDGPAPVCPRVVPLEYGGTPPVGDALPAADNATQARRGG